MAIVTAKVIMANGSEGLLMIQNQQSSVSAGVKSFQDANEAITTNTHAFSSAKRFIPADDSLS